MTLFGVIFAVFAFVLGLLFGIKIQIVVSIWQDAKANVQWTGHRKLKEVRKAHGDSVDDGSHLHEPLKQN